MSARCERTDLLVEMCAHCLGHLEEAPVTVTRSLVAQYPGRCTLNARHSIEPGDLIGQVDDGWVCSSCREAHST